jgi:hypothetical protein
MTSVTMVVFTVVPAVPVMVSVYVPRATFLFVLIVSVDVPEPEMVDGLNDAVAHFGRPLMASAIVPEPPGLAVMVYVVRPEGAIVRLEGVADREKFPLTTSVIVAVRINGPLVPLIVS